MKMNTVSAKLPRRPSKARATILLWIPMLLWTLGSNLAAQDPAYVLSITDGFGSAGGTVDVSVFLDTSAGEDVQGWSYGACTDPSQVSVIAVQAGETSAGFDGGAGAAFHNINLFANGWTVGLVIAFSAVTLAPGSGYEIEVATVACIGSAGELSAIDFCDTLGTPPVPTVVVVGGAPLLPTQQSGIVCIGAPPEFPIFIAPHHTATGSPTTLTLAVDGGGSTEDGGIGETQGFSMGLSNDPTQVTVTGLAPAGPLVDLDPPFFEGGVFPDGWTLGVVYSFAGVVLLTLDGPTELVAATYQLGGLDEVGESTPLIWTNSLGQPPVANVAVVSGQSLPPVFQNGSITYLGLPQFVRGDCNDDGLVDIADGVWVISELFLEGPASGCAAACDANADGLFDVSDAVFIWNFRFLDGPAPSGPFPVCGDGFGAPCDSFSNCP